MRLEEGIKLPIAVHGVSGTISMPAPGPSRLARKRSIAGYAGLGAVYPNIATLCKPNGRGEDDADLLGSQSSIDRSYQSLLG